MRHAYLIITHGSFDILEKQLRFLESENADFFIHVDAKVTNFDFEKYASIPKMSRVTFVDRYSISWGHFSMVEAELALLRAAVPGHYDYYHLLSGVDVPVKSREYIENYFSSGGTNYINFQRPAVTRADLRRVRYYYPFQKYNIRRRFIRLSLQRLTMYAQMPFVNRLRRYKNTEIQKGAQWFSITNDLAGYVLSRETEIREMFHDTFIPDEVFLHTLVINSPFRDTLPENAFADDYRSCLRYIDWSRGKPYSFTEEDFEELTHLPPEYLFARKFDCRNHAEIIDRLFDHFGGEGD